MAETRIGAFLRLLWLRLHESQDIASVSWRGHSRLPTVANLWQKGKENELLGLLTVWKSAVHFQPIGITRFAAHSTTSAKRKMKPPIGVGLYITDRAILNIGLYNRYLQRGLLKLSFCITIYLYRTIHYHAVVLVKNCTPISLYIHTYYIPIQMYLI